MAALSAILDFRSSKFMGCRVWRANVHQCSKYNWHFLGLRSNLLSTDARCLMVIMCNMVDFMWSSVVWSIRVSRYTCFGDRLRGGRFCRGSKFNISYGQSHAVAVNTVLALPRGRWRCVCGAIGINNAGESWRRACATKTESWCR